MVQEIAEKGQECLTIRVVDPSGAPAPTATVTVTIGAVDQPTDNAGTARFCGLGNGPHSVTVAAPNLRTTTQTVDQITGSVTIALRLEIVSSEVVGTRSEGREPLASPVPVELVIGERLRNSGHVETGRALQMLTPSFNFQSFAITDGTDSVRPATLRGLGPDQVLALVKASNDTTARCSMCSTPLAAAPPART